VRRRWYCCFDDGVVGRLEVRLFERSTDVVDDLLRLDGLRRLALEGSPEDLRANM
jgi:hypothetical protein